MKRIHELNSIVDCLFQTMEEIKELFSKWEPSCSLSLIQKVMHLNVLREQLYRLGFDEDFVETVIKVVYEHVFSKDEQLKYAGN